jgi:hypothetical protein
VKAEASGTRGVLGPVDTLFELLRYDDGGFTFEAGTIASDASAPAKVEPLLHEAEQLMEEWRIIAKVVPSMDAWVALAPELAGGDVVIDSTRWRAVVAVGGGSTVWSVGDQLGLSEVPLCRSLKELVELGLLTVGMNPGTGPNAGTRASSTSVGGDEIVFSEFGDATTPDLIPVDDKPSPSPSPSPAVASLADKLLIDSDNNAEVAPPPDRPLLPPAVFADAAPDEADEVARQLANLSPQAARAVAAAAQASTDEEREAALAEVNEDEEPINRGLLLKFLSSVRS